MWWKLLMAVGLVIGMAFIGNRVEDVRQLKAMNSILDSAQAYQRLTGYGLKEQKIMQHWIYADTLKY